MDRITTMIKWMMENWKPACALIYTIVCVFDFVVYPSWVGWHRLPLADFVSLTDHLDSAMRTTLSEYVYRPYSPYTLSGGGLFHLSFGAILTGVAVTNKVTQVIDDRRKKDDTEVTS